jgi:beta-lactamase class A
MTQTASQRNTLPILEIAGLLMLLLATVLLVTQLSSFSQTRQNLPAGLELGGVPVSGLPRSEAQAYIEQVYGAPITVKYREQEILLNPAELGLQVNSEAMLSKADELRTEGNFWAGFWDYLWRRPEQTYEVALDLIYSEDLLRSWVADIATRYDSPPQPAQAVLQTLSFESGQPGYTLDQEAAVEMIDAALRQPSERVVELPVESVQAPRPGLDTLSTLLTDYLVSEEFEGIASIYVIDLQTGEEMELDVDLRQGSASYLNCEVAYASTSTMKINIMVEYFRYLDWLPTPGSDALKILTETMNQSGNISANFMLQEIGYGDVYDGADTVTQSVQHLGLKNTFIVAPYDDEEDPVYYSTPAREAARAGTCVDTKADLYMQTTVQDLAVMMDMIYQCAEYGGGGLMAAYPGDITQDECKMMLDIMSQNFEGQLILAGVPEDTSVAHKHGWTYDTHGDAGVVFSPGGDYALSVFLWADVNWLDVRISFPIIEGISAATFNYFNPNLVLTPRRGLSLDE